MTMSPHQSLPEIGNFIKNHSNVEEGDKPGLVMKKRNFIQTHNNVEDVVRPAVGLVLPHLRL